MAAIIIREMKNGITHQDSTRLSPVTHKTQVGARSRINHRGSASHAEDVTVPEGVYLKWVKNQLDSESACLELPFTIMLLLSFSGLALMHLQQDVVLSVEHSIEFDICENANFAFEPNFGNKVIFDVHSFADFWSWVRLGLIPLLMQPAWSYSEGYSDAAANLFPDTANVTPNSAWAFQNFGASAKTIPVTGDYLHYNRIIGGLRFRQQVAPSSYESCRFPSGRDNEIWYQWYGKPCMPAWQELPFEPNSMDSETFDAPEREEWMFLMHASIDEMVQKAVDMEDGCEQLEAKGRACLCTWCAQRFPPSPWLTEETQRIEISFASFNAEYGLITMTGINFFFSRGSEIRKRVEMMSSWLDPLSAPLSMIIPMLMFDTVWLTMLLYIMITEIMEVVHVIRKGSGPHWYDSLKNEYIAFWNIVDWLSIVVAIVLVSMAAELMIATRELHGAFEGLMQSETAGVGRQSMLQQIQIFYEDLGNMLGKERFFRLTLCMYPMMVMLRLFKSFAAQARLAVVTDTLSTAAQDLVHFFIVFFATFFCLCLTSVLFFGQDLEEFATIFRATHTCFRMMFGDWDWESMGDIRRNVAMMWFSGFMLLMVMILLNMLLAIIMENYMKVKKKISDPALAPSLSRQIREMWRRRQQFKAGLRVRLNDIYDAFLLRHSGNEKELFASTQIITPADVLEVVSGITVNQAQRTMKNASEAHTKATTKEFELSDLRAKGHDEQGNEVPSPFERLEDVTRQVRDGLLYILDRVQFYDTVATESGFSKDVTSAAAEAAAASAQAKGDNPGADELLEFVSAEVGRLNYETASILGQTVRRVDLRQRHIETRQAEMEDSIREMHQTMLNLQSEASSISNKLQRLLHDRGKGMHGSAWRQGLAAATGGAVPACFSACGPDSMEGPGLPMPIRR